MTATIDRAAPLDELELSNLASFWAGARAAARMSTTLDMGQIADDQLAALIDPDTSAEISKAITEILLRAGKPQPRPPAEPRLPVRVPARPGVRPR